MTYTNADWLDKLTKEHRLINLTQTNNCSHYTEQTSKLTKQQGGETLFYYLLGGDGNVTMKLAGSIKNPKRYLEMINKSNTLIYAEHIEDGKVYFDRRDLIP